MVSKRSVKHPVEHETFFREMDETNSRIHGIFERFTNSWEYNNIIPSLTLVKAKNGYRPCNYAVCSHFLFGSDLCYFFTFPVLVFFMMLRIADFEINS